MFKHWITYLLFPFFLFFIGCSGNSALVSEEDDPQADDVYFVEKQSKPVVASHSDERDLGYYEEGEKEEGEEKADGEGEEADYYDPEEAEQMRYEELRNRRDYRVRGGSGVLYSWDDHYYSSNRSPLYATSPYGTPIGGSHLNSGRSWNYMSMYGGSGFGTSTTMGYWGDPYLQAGMRSIDERNDPVLNVPRGTGRLPSSETATYWKRENDRREQDAKRGSGKSLNSGEKSGISSGSRSSRRGGIMKSGDNDYWNENGINSNRRSNNSGNIRIRSGSNNSGSSIGRRSSSPSSTKSSISSGSSSRGSSDGSSSGSSRRKR